MAISYIDTHMTKLPLDHSFKHKVALVALPIKGCCGKGCKKCNFGRWKKHRPRTLVTLCDELIKRVPEWLWLVFVVLSFICGAMIYG